MKYNLYKLLLKIAVTEREVILQDYYEASVVKLLSFKVAWSLIQVLKEKFCKIKGRYWLTYKFTMLLTTATTALKYFSFSLGTFFLFHNKPF